MEKIEEKFRHLVADQLGVDLVEVEPNASFVDDLGADSLDQLELVMGCEDEFAIVIPDEDAVKINTVGAAVQYLKEHTK